MLQSSDYEDFLRLNPWSPHPSLPQTSEGKSDLSCSNLLARTRCQLGLQPQEKELAPPTEGKSSISIFDSLNLSAGAIGVKM